MPESISKELINAYCGTQYCIFASSSFRLEIDIYSDSIADLHSEYACTSSAFITAFNPYSLIDSDRNNERNNHSLKAVLDHQSRVLFAAEGRDPQGNWPTEKGFLAIGISPVQARNTGRLFKQNAIVTIGKNAVPQLCLCC